MSDNDDDDGRPAVEAASTSPLDSHHHHDISRTIIRLIQCPLCSHLFCNPVRLPCGNAICRACLPKSYKREGISYPMVEGRAEGFQCPFSAAEEDGRYNGGSDKELGVLRRCGYEHAVGDCGVDVTLSKVVEIVEESVRRFTAIKGREGSVVAEEDEVGSEGLPGGGRFVTAYTLADRGELEYTADVVYSSSVDGDDDSSLVNADDREVLDHIKTAIRNELDCLVCYALMLDPLTTSCGHTFCRTCVARVLDHSNLCPICRRKLPIVTLVDTEPSNARLSQIIQKLFPEQLSARLEASRTEDLGVDISDSSTVPLFICTLSFPSVSTYLHIFEPRYRLMIRRAMQSGSRKFGMVLPNRTGLFQGALGRSPFLRYGTLLHINRFELLPDGRSLISTTGVSKFKVVSYSVLDGYYVGKVERIDDIPLAEEESREASETRTRTITTTTATRPRGEEVNARSIPLDLDRLSTQQLLQLGLDYAEKSREDAAPWLQGRVLAAHGQPPSDAAVFPYWLASVLPIPEEERYALLPVTSVRERLKMTVKWIRMVENKQCDSPSPFHFEFSLFLPFGLSLSYTPLTQAPAAHQQQQHPFTTAPTTPHGQTHRTAPSLGTENAQPMSIPKSIFLSALIALLVERVWTRLSALLRARELRRRQILRREETMRGAEGDNDDNNGREGEGEEVGDIIPLQQPPPQQQEHEQEQEQQQQDDVPERDID
ncbi:hypothetical protein AJ80_05142 [Polytolypa hystricis UAMH7299]|uniref:RING-type domain-containing protein n=1 Tax=Polytolypa hystricis (strain UAMH7299) TaxID=1447883 RepID=A0A2B7Y5X8_POLH7|nr:hypothetical protein AJ80_05142 [Polytolypa hystricis UAMH7299]